jgi:hypothetical protein
MPYTFLASIATETSTPTATTVVNRASARLRWAGTRRSRNARAVAARLAKARG